MEGNHFLLFSTPSQPTSVITAASHQSLPNHGAVEYNLNNNENLLLIPASLQQQITVSHMPQSICGKTTVSFNPSTTESSFSLGMAGTSPAVTGIRSSSVARIRFDDSKSQVDSDRCTRSEPSTPTPSSPIKKSILKKQANDGMETYAHLLLLLFWVT